MTRGLKAYTIPLTLGALLLGPACHDDHGHDDHDHQRPQQGEHPRRAHEDEDHQHAQEPADHEGGHEHQGEHPEPSGHVATQCTGHLSADELNGLSVTFSRVEPRPRAPSRKLPAEIRVDPDRQVVLSAATGGRILALDAPRHARIKPGQRLAVLELIDPDIRRQQVQAVKARAALLAARTEARRTRVYLDALEGQGGSMAEERQRVAADLAVLQAQVSSHKSELDALLQALRLAGLGQAQLQALERAGQVATRITLRAPALPGRPALQVISRPVSRGQTVEPGAQLYELAALDRLLVVASAFEADLPAVRRAFRQGLPVRLLQPAEGEAVEGLKIFSVEGVLDGEERVTHCHLELPNTIVSEKRLRGASYVDWAYRAGTRVQVLVPTGRAEPHFTLPAGAVVRSGGRYYVFRAGEAGCHRVPVSVTSASEREVMVPAGGALRPGDRIATSGALQLHLAMEAKNPASSGSTGGHAHSH